MSSFNVTVMNRDQAIKYCKQAHDQDTILISISAPSHIYDTEPFVTTYNRIQAILSLRFADTDIGTDTMTKYDAKRIKKFLELHPDVDIIVHCDAGQSRSAGIAGAILKHYTGDDSQIFNNPRYKPNMRCYRTLLNELEE